MKAGLRRGNKEMLGRDWGRGRGEDFYFLFGYSFPTIAVMRSLNERGVNVVFVTRDGRKEKWARK